MKRNYQLKDVTISKATQRKLFAMRWFLRPLIWLVSLLPRYFATLTQLRLSKGLKDSYADQPVDYDVLGAVPGYVVGTLMAEESIKTGTVLLYLHGGGFIMPAIPDVHVGFHARLCRDLGAVGFMPDYRLAPLHKFPSSLDDCERAYRGLLELGYSADRILLAGESAGGNLTLGLLQRIRRLGLPMPVCAVPLSPVTEVTRVHSPPSRTDIANKDPMLPVKAFSKMLLFYADGLDGGDPELSPVLADYEGFPPLYFIVGEAEVLLDDSLMAARCARRAGVEAKLDVWPALPHAFPLMGNLFPEAKQARVDIVAFMREKMDERVAA